MNTLILLTFSGHDFHEVPFITESGDDNELTNEKFLLLQRVCLLIMMGTHPSPQQKEFLGGLCYSLKLSGLGYHSK